MMFCAMCLFELIKVSYLISWNESDNEVHNIQQSEGTRVSTKRWSSLPTWLGWMLGIVEDQHITGGGLGGDDAGVLGHVAGTVYLPFMVDLDLNLYLTTHWPKASKLCTIHISLLTKVQFFFKKTTTVALKNKQTKDLKVRFQSKRIFFVFWGGEERRKWRIHCLVITVSNNIWGLLLLNKRKCTDSNQISRLLCNLNTCMAKDFNLRIGKKHKSVCRRNNNNNNNNECISRAPFHVKHAHLHWTGANTKIQNACI